MAEVWCSLVWLLFIWNATIFCHVSYIGIVHTTSAVHSSHIIHTLTSKPTERQGFTPVTPHRDVHTEHVPSPKRSVGNHIGHALEAGHDSPPHHITTAGDFGIHLILSVYPSLSLPPLKYILYIQQSKKRSKPVILYRTSFYFHFILKICKPVYSFYIIIAIINALLLCHMWREILTVTTSFNNLCGVVIFICHSGCSFPEYFIHFFS